MMVGTSLVPWNGPRGFCMLVKGLSGQEEDSGFQKTTEPALSVGGTSGVT